MERVELYENDQLTYDVDSDENSEQKGFNRELDEGNFKPQEKSQLADEKIREIILPVTDAGTDGKILRYACELARTFSARIALVISVPPLVLSDDILEYSRIESYKDFYSDHVQSSGEAALAKISSRLQKEGIEFRKVITSSNQKKIIDELLKGPTTQTIAIVLRGGGKNSASGRLGFIGGLPAAMILKSKIPVFVIP
jgi:nucleotide-binding universal stress UspA family protein